MLNNRTHNSENRLLKGSNFQTYIGFPEKCIKVLKTGHFPTIVEFLEEFIEKCPLERNYLVQAFTQFSSYGKNKLADECGRIHAETSKKLSDEAQQTLGVPPIYECVSTDACHVSVMDQLVLTKTMLDTGSLKQKPILAIDSNSLTNSETALLPYLEEVFDVVLDEPQNALLFKAMCPISPFAPIFYKKSENQYGHNRTFFYNLNTNSPSCNLKQHTFDLKDETVNKAKVFFDVNNYKLQEEFIVLYFNEDQEISNPRCKIDPLSFVKAIDHIIHQGFQVVRIGTNKASPIPARHGLLDLTNIERPLEVDLFLCGTASLYLGTSSGPYSIAQNFGVPIAEIARFDYGGVRPGNFVQYLSFLKPDSQRKYTFSEIKTLGFLSTGSLRAFEVNGLVPTFPTSKENLKFVEEALEYFDNNRTAQNEIMKSTNYQRFNIWGDLTTESLELLN